MSYAARRFSREKRLARRRTRGLGFEQGNDAEHRHAQPFQLARTADRLRQKLKCQHQQKAQSQAGGGAACDEEGPVGRKGLDQAGWRARLATAARRAARKPSLSYSVPSADFRTRSDIAFEGSRRDFQAA